MKNFKRFNITPNSKYGNDIGEKILEIEIANDGSFIGGSTANFLFKTYYRNLISRNKDKEEISQKNISIFEMHPSFDKKNYLACTIGNEILMINFQNDGPIMKKYINEQEIKINFLQWQQKNSTILASASSNKIIYIYDIHNLISKIEDDEIASSMKFLSIIDCKSKEFQILITGYEGKIKLWNFTEEIPKTPFHTKNVLNDKIDIIEGNNNGCYILIGSKKNRILQNYEFITNQIFFVFELRIPEEGKNIIHVSYFKKEGIVVACQSCCYLYYINDKVAILDQCFKFEQNINNFAIHCNCFDTKGYFVFTINQKFFVVELIFNNSNLKYQSCLISMKNEESINTKNFYIIMKNKEDIIIEKKNEYSFDIQIREVIIQVLFNSKNSFPTISIKKNNNLELNDILKESIKKFESNKNQNKSLINFIDELINLVKSNSLSKKEYFKKTVPYMKTCTFSWIPNGQIIFFQYNKIDFKQLKEKDKEITSSTNLKNWSKFCLNKNASIKQILNDDKLIEEEEEEEIKQIITQPLYKVINWDFSFDTDINEIFNYINSPLSLPTIFANNSNFKNNNQISFLNKNSLVNTEIPHKLNITSNEVNDQKKIFYNVKNLENEMKILNNLKIQIFSKESLYDSLLNIKDDDLNKKILLDLLEQIKNNFEKLKYQKYQVLLKFYKQKVLTILKTLEKKKEYEYLFIIVVEISKIMFSDIINQKIDNSFKENRYNNTIEDSKSINLNKMKKNSLIITPLSPLSAKPLNSEQINTLSQEENILIGSSNESIGLDYDSELLSSNYDKGDSYKNNSNSFELNEEKDDNDDKDKINDINLIFNKKFKITLLLYLYYFSCELEKKQRFVEKNEIRIFLELIYLKFKLCK